jgi:hypothetical protein
MSVTGSLLIQYNFNTEFSMKKSALVIFIVLVFGTVAQADITCDMANPNLDVTVYSGHDFRKNNLGATAAIQNQSAVFALKSQAGLDTLHPALKTGSYLVEAKGFVENGQGYKLPNQYFTMGAAVIFPDKTIVTAGFKDFVLVPAGAKKGLLLSTPVKMVTIEPPTIRYDRTVNSLQLESHGSVPRTVHVLCEELSDMGSVVGACRGSQLTNYQTFNPNVALINRNVSLTMRCSGYTTQDVTSKDGVYTFGFASPMGSERVLD